MYITIFHFITNVNVDQLQTQKKLMKSGDFGGMDPVYLFSFAPKKANDINKAMWICGYPAGVSRHLSYQRPACPAGVKLRGLLCFSICLMDKDFMN